MPKSRLEAFSDGVIAIIITIMVLELEVPHGDSLRDLAERLPTFLAYLLSFVYVGIYWNNHHHMLHATERVSGGILWANLHLLFWLSLIPFVTAWCGARGLELTPTPVACYGIVLLLCAIAYTILQAAIIRAQGANSRLRAAVGGDRKGKISIALYVAAIALASFALWASVAIYIAVAVIWLAPDRRIESQLRGR
jgi:uncharacterized membrane protein